jgi:hypothetical protein
VTGRSHYFTDRFERTRLQPCRSKSRNGLGPSGKLSFPYKIAPATPIISIQCSLMTVCRCIPVWPKRGSMRGGKCAHTRAR